jgi:CBS domain-containing protein
MSDPFQKRSVSEIMRRHVVTISPEETVLEAERIMQVARIRHLPVVKAGVLVGVLSDRDVLGASPGSLESENAAERVEQLRSLPIEKVMTATPETIGPECELNEAAVRMIRLKISCLPVVQAGERSPRLLGLLTLTDLVQAAYAPDVTDASD